MPAAPARPPAPDRTADARLDAGQLRLSGDWTLGNACDVASALDRVKGPVRGIDAGGVDALDSLGVLRILHFAKQKGLENQAITFQADHQPLVDAIEDVVDERPSARKDYGLHAALGRLGFAVVNNAKEVVALVSFLGENLWKLWGIVRHPSRLRLVSVVHHMEQVGLDAVPLVALLTFLVGAVVAFLGANVLQDFGATQYVVELVSISFLREFAVLLTAIVLAGRTASAFTAQIGAMVSGEEVDAMRTLGLDPVEVLVIPRVIALLVMLPLLTFLAMLAGLLGGMAVAAFSLDIPPQAYYARMEQTMEVRHFLVGMSKAPVFAMVIALIGCLEGLQVEGTAQSVGERTTSSVVQAISLVIVLDAIAAMWFMYMGW